MQEYLTELTTVGNKINISSLAGGQIAKLDYYYLLKL
jgi:hypothetical protein